MTVPRPLGDVLPGVEIRPLDEGWTGLEVVALVKCLDEGGEARWLLRSSDGLSDVEVIGALTTTLDVTRHNHVMAWESDE